MRPAISRLRPLEVLALIFPYQKAPLFAVTPQYTSLLSKRRPYSAAGGGVGAYDLEEDLVIYLLLFLNGRRIEKEKALFAKAPEAFY